VNIAERSLNLLVMTNIEYLRSDEFVYRHVAGEHLLVALRRDRQAPLFMLSVTGAYLWERLSSWSTADMLAAALEERFEVDGDTAASDVATFLAQLHELGAVKQREVI
jgi:hypothetical protein